MALIESIQAQVVTGRQAVTVSGQISPPGTDGDVYLGIGGREFHLER